MGLDDTVAEEIHKAVNSLRSAKNSLHSLGAGLLLAASTLPAYSHTQMYDRNYKEEQIASKNDFTKVLDKTLHIMPEGYMGGVLGFTYLSENFMARKDNLLSDKALEVDVHESIHTNDEYETRVITWWMLSKEPPAYKR